MNLYVLQRNPILLDPETSLKDIIDDMMIISWVESVNYDKYYEQCAPSICTYILITRNHLLYVFTTMISLLAGVSTALRILIPIIINWIRNRIHRTSENNNPTSKLFL